VALFHVAIIAGLVAGLARAQLKHRAIRVPPVRKIWLVLVAFFAQALIFEIGATRQAITGPFASGIFIGSQILLLFFIWINRRQPGFWSLGLGLALNLAAVSLNGGWMPVSPQIISQVIPSSPGRIWNIGERVRYSKDQVLDPASIRLSFLTDQFLLPGWIPYRVAFSIGDVFVAIGAFLLMWSLGSGDSQQDQKSK
jgi:hypothetical protein